MNPLLLAALAAGGAFIVVKKVGAPATVPPVGSALDPGMDTYTSAVISKALSIETDTTILDQLATDLAQSGFKNSANAVATRSKALKNNIQSPSKGS